MSELTKSRDGETVAAKPHERRHGSTRNKEGSASTTRGGITLSDANIKTLQDKVKAHNEKYGDTPSKKASLGALKAVFRRGAGAFSTSHRRGVSSRDQWAIARCNAFLKLLASGAPSNPKYTTDNDLLPSGHPRATKQKSLDETPDLMKGYAVPESIRSAARRGLELRSKAPKSSKGGLDASQAKKEGIHSGVEGARALASGSVSEDKIRRMVRFFARHAKNISRDSSKPIEKDRGYVAGLLWGGAGAASWARGMVAKIERGRTNKSMPPVWSVHDVFRDIPLSKAQMETFEPLIHDGLSKGTPALEVAIRAAAERLDLDAGALTLLVERTNQLLETNLD